MTAKGSVPVNLFGDEMAGCGASPSSTQAMRKRVAFLPDAADSSSSSSSSGSSSRSSSCSSSSSSSNSSSSSRSSSNKADGEWTQKLKEALTETKRAGAARNKTAAVFSAAPGELLKQGNQTALISLCYSYDKLEAEACPAAFWALKGPFRTQLQPVMRVNA